MKMIKECEEGQILPAWYYGLSYIDHMRRISIFHPIPINYLIRWKMDLSYLWNRLRSRRSYVDQQIVTLWAQKGRELEAKLWLLEKQERELADKIAHVKRVRERLFDQERDLILREKKDRGEIP